MRKIIIAALALAGLATPAAAETITATVTPVGTYSGDLAVLTDNVIPANGSVYNGPDKVAFGDTTSFMFNFGATYSIDSLLANVDNNDNYLFSFFNGVTLVGAVQILAGEGTVGSGVETFTKTFAPISASMVIVTATPGDHLNALGEVQFRSSAVAPVPEPATWAMMLLGFGGIGLALRRSRRDNDLVRIA